MQLGIFLNVGGFRVGRQKTASEFVILGSLTTRGKCANLSREKDFFKESLPMHAPNFTLF